MFQRRDVLKLGLGLGAAALTGCQSFMSGKSAGGGFRFVHLTDLHIQPEKMADQGVIAALGAVERLDPKPDFILLGGDLIMDATGQEEARARMLFELWNKVTGDHTGIKLVPCIGNHDVFAWGAQDKVSPDHAAYGKAMVKEYLGLEKTYYAFDHKGWRFYVLDNIQYSEESRSKYKGEIDEEQLVWLKADLAAKPASTPAVVVSHIPILTVTLFRSDERILHDDMYHIGTGGVCKNGIELGNLFAQHNVRIALSGHIHEIDRVDWRGVTFICDGAVSGNWWKGPLNGFEEGFGILDLAADGGFTHAYHDYGWTV